MIFERSFDNLSQKDIELLNSYFDGYDYQSSSHTLVANYISVSYTHLTLPTN